MNIFKRFFKKLGPGIVTGAADDDPSGIATYSQTGAQFGYNQLWTALYMLPFLIAIQEACARIGEVTGNGLSTVIKQHYGKKILYFMVMLLVIANTINIGADLGAMAAALHLIVPIHFIVLTLIFTTLTLLLEVFISYRRYANFLKWLSLSLLVYPLTALIIHAPWGTILKATFVPHIEFDFQFLFIITGVFGTTISPYMFFWQTTQVVEEERELGLLNAYERPQITTQMLRNVRLDNFIGMFFSEITTWAIIVVSATVFNNHGITDIKTSADAAQALLPLVQTFPHAGFLAEMLFAIGIIGLGLLAVPVLAASAAYAISETLNWNSGLNLTLNKAWGFYSIITLATLLGLCINYIGINPIKTLVYAAVINGILSIPLLFIIALIAGNKKIMGRYKSKFFSNLFVWLTFIGISITSIAMLKSFLIK